MCSVFDPQNVNNNCSVHYFLYTSIRLILVRDYKNIYYNIVTDCFTLLYFALVVDDAKCIVGTRVCVTVCPQPYAHTIAQTRM